MALKKVQEDIYGTQYPNAYHRVVDARMHYGGSYGDISVFVYETKEARDAGNSPIASLSYQFNVETTPSFSDVFGTVLEDEDMTPRKSAYLYLKTLPKYSGAIDC